LNDTQESTPNKYQAFVDQALGSHIGDDTPAKKKARTSKTSSESSTTSFGVTSVNVPDGTVVTTDNNRELTAAELAQMQAGAARLPNGQTMCLSTEECERIVASRDA